MTGDEAFDTFELGFSEVGILYGMLYVNSLIGLSPSALMDEVEKRELFPGYQHAIPIAIENKIRLMADMREFIVEQVGEEKLLELEAAMRKTVKEEL